MNNPTKRRSPLSLVLLVLVILFCGCSRSGETIVLRFVDEDGKPIAGVKARINRSDDVVLKSDQKGFCTYNFTEYFIVEAQHPEYVGLSCWFGPGIESIPKEQSRNYFRKFVLGVKV